MHTLEYRYIVELATSTTDQAVVLHVGKTPKQVRDSSYPGMRLTVFQQAMRSLKPGLEYCQTWTLSWPAPVQGRPAPPITHDVRSQLIEIPV